MKKGDAQAWWLFQETDQEHRGGQGLLWKGKPEPVITQPDLYPKPVTTTSLKLEAATMGSGIQVLLRRSRQQLLLDDTFQ